MQNVIRLVIVFLLITINSYAQEGRFLTSLSLVTMSMDYREYDRNGQILDSEKSSFSELGGIDIGVRYLLASTNRSKTEIQSNLIMLGGYTDYKGSILNSGNPYGSYVSRTVNKIMDIDLGVRQSYFVGDKIQLSAGLGLGYRYWDRALSTSQVEDYRWYSLRAMIGATYQTAKKLSFGAELEYQSSFKETMGASNLGSTFTLGGADIVTFSIPMVYKYNVNMDFTAKFIYEKQTIVASNVINGYYEPDSTAKNKYIQVGVDFKF